MIDEQLVSELGVRGALAGHPRRLAVPTRAGVAMPLRYLGY